MSGQSVDFRDILAAWLTFCEVFQETLRQRLAASGFYEKWAALMKMFEEMNRFR